MSYANMDGVPAQTAGTSEILASDWNTYVRDNFDSIKFGHVVCTSSTRPTGVAEGTMIYETDTNKVLVYDASSWRPTGNVDIATSTTRPSTTFEGQVLYETDSNKVLIYNGSSWVEVADLDSADGLSASAQTKVSNIGLDFIVKSDYSNASTVSVNGCFTSAYENYRVVGFLTSSISTGGDIRLRATTDNSTANSYERQGLAGTGSTAVAGNVISNLWSSMWVGEPTIISSFAFDIFRPQKAERTGIFVLAGRHNQIQMRSGDHNQSTAYDGFTLLPQSGTISGTLRVYGYKDG